MLGVRNSLTTDEQGHCQLFLSGVASEVKAAVKLILEQSTAWRNI